MMFMVFTTAAWAATWLVPGDGPLETVVGLTAPGDTILIEDRITTVASIAVPHRLTIEGNVANARIDFTGSGNLFYTDKDLTLRSLEVNLSSAFLVNRRAVHAVDGARLVLERCTFPNSTPAMTSS